MRCEGGLQHSRKPVATAPAANPAPWGDPIPGALRLVWIHELNIAGAGAYLVKGLIEPGAFVLLTGASGSGKTNLAIDISLAVASGRPWRDRKVEAGVVVYAALEAAGSVRNRLLAARLCDPSLSTYAHICVIDDPVDLTGDAGVKDMVATIHQAAQDRGGNVRLLVVDTLARALAGGDENSGADMGGLIARLDRIRAETGVAILLLHHLGKNLNGGARGHSSLKAAADTEIEIQEAIDGARVATATKQRNLEAGARFGFTIGSLAIGNDIDGAPITAATLVHADVPANARRAPGGPRQRDVLRLVEAETRGGNAVIPRGQLVKLAETRLGMSRSSANTAVDGLANAGHIIATVGGMKLTEAPSP